MILLSAVMRLTLVLAKVMLVLEIILVLLDVMRLLEIVVLRVSHVPSTKLALPTPKVRVATLLLIVSHKATSTVSTKLANTGCLLEMNAQTALSASMETALMELAQDKLLMENAVVILIATLDYIVAIKMLPTQLAKTLLLRDKPVLPLFLAILEMFVLQRLMVMEQPVNKSDHNLLVDHVPQKPAHLVWLVMVPSPI